MPQTCRTSRFGKPLQWLLCLLLLVGSWQPCMAAELHKNVLVLYGAGRLLPAAIEFDKALRKELQPSGAQIFDEFLDVSRFSGQTQEQLFARYLRDKYVSLPPDVIVAAGEDALLFIAKNRAKLFPQTSVIYTSVGPLLLRELGTLPANYIGQPIGFNFIATIEQALRWHPHTRRLVLVTGTSPADHELRAQLSKAASAFEGRVQVEYLNGLPTAQLLEKLRALPRDALVVSPGYFKDGAGADSYPRDISLLMSDTLTVPFYGPFTTFLGTGIVGGYMISWTDYAIQVGSIVEQLLSGATPISSLAMPTLTPVMHVDWQVAQRWGIDEKDFPPGTVVHFREPGIFELYGKEITATGLLLLLLLALIFGLLIERRRRRTAEKAMQERTFELAHASRLAIAGQLTASIAHEINQPLGAILSNAETAELLLASPRLHQQELQQILGDIRRDNHRASEVIRRLRALLNKHEQERKPVDINQVLEDVIELLRHEAQRRKIRLKFYPCAQAVRVLGDRIQLQQVLINLIFNAMDAVGANQEDQREIRVAVIARQTTVTIRVHDYGHGIAAQDMPRIFESFFTSKPEGMGLGLPIVKTIVEAHGGTLQADSSAENGTVFSVELPLIVETAR